MGRRALGWLAVTAQFAAIIAIALTARAADPGAGWWRAVGWSTAVLGAVVLVLGLVNLGRALTPTPVPNGGPLQQGGLYGRVRHPIYTGVLLLMLGVVLLGPGAWPLLWWLVLLAVLSAKARWEEHMLCERFPDYARYMQRTGRFLPRLRRM